ncbi:hypothetical protein [Streptomyces sp. WM6349]|uniref:zinc finger domain-containing protein n=1 Tax=Streptomyces sp. WM6349 TaxID=1415552 RepID=UPI00099BB224
MPAALRQGRPPRHPALAIRCPHCGAAPNHRCTTRAGRTRTTRLIPCPARLEAHALTDVCPECQVAAGTPCRDSHGHETAVHTARYTTAQETR